MFGIAIGSIGISLDDFMRLTPDQFNAVYEQWNKQEIAKQQASWEQARFIAHCAVAPYTKKGMAPTDLVRFPWDTVKEEQETIATREDFERIIERFGE